MADEQDSRCTGGIINLKTTEETLKIFECPICFEALWPPVLSCSEGHNICQKCHLKCQKCPSCQQDHPRIRNRGLEDIIMQADHSCIYQDQGCAVALPGNDILEHQKLCEFGHVVCCTLCNKPEIGQIPMSTFIEHLEGVHSIKVNEEFETEWEVNYKITSGVLCKSPRKELAHKNILYRTGPVWPYTIKIYQGHKFISRVFTWDNNLCWSVGMVSNEINANDFHAVINISKGGEDKIEKPLTLAWSVPVHSISLNQEEVLKGFCGVCPLDFMETHLTIPCEDNQCRQFTTVFQIVGPTAARQEEVVSRESESLLIKF